MKRNCLTCPAYGKDGRCQLDGARHLDCETFEAVDCIWNKSLGDITMSEMLDTLKICCVPGCLKCLYCPFKNTGLCKHILATPASIQTAIDSVIKEFTSPDDELPF